MNWAPGILLTSWRVGWNVYADIDRLRFGAPFRIIPPAPLWITYDGTVGTARADPALTSPLYSGDGRRDPREGEESSNHRVSKQYDYDARNSHQCAQYHHC